MSHAKTLIAHAAGTVTILSIGGSTVALAGDCLSPSWLSPSADRWNYPFNTTPGTKPDTKIFGAYEATGLSPDFDNRDGQMAFGFDTTDQVTPGLTPDAYEIFSATVTLMVESEDTFSYDPTVDPWASYLLEDDPDHVPDPDPGRPVELFGAGFRNGFDSLTWQEDTPYSSGGTFGKSIRTVWPLAFDQGSPYDVSNNVDDQVDPVPFAVGINASLAPGDTVAQLTTMTFEISVEDPDIQQYLRESLNDGRVLFTIASLFPASEQVGGSFPEFFTKEAAAVDADLADAAQLFLDVRVGQAGDVNNSGGVNIEDLLAVLGSWGACGDETCPADTNCDGVVDIIDLLTVLGEWG